MRRLGLLAAGCAVLLACSAAASAGRLAPARTAARVAVAVAVPPAGRIDVALFSVRVRLPTGARAPRAPEVAPLARGTLPAGVAVVGRVRELRASTPGWASYVGVLAAFHAGGRSVASLSGPPEKPDLISAMLTFGFGMELKEAGTGNEPPIIDEIDVQDVAADQREQYRQIQRAMAPHPAATPKPTLATLEPSVLDGLDTAAAGWGDGHDFSWSVDRAVSPQALGDLLTALDASVRSDALTGDALLRFERLLSPRFPAFRPGSLQGDEHAAPTPPPTTTTAAPPPPKAMLSCASKTFANAVTKANETQGGSPGSGIGGNISFSCDDPGNLVVTSVRIQAAGHTFARGLPGGGAGESCGAAGDTLTCIPGRGDSGNGVFGDNVSLYYSQSDSVATEGSCGVRLAYELLAGGAVAYSGSVIQFEQGC